MKSVVLILTIVAVVSAVPTPTKLNFRNLFKPSVNELKTKVHPRIIGGQEAVPHSIPFQAFLTIYDNDEGWYCGGSLISANYVLTAGHCGDGAVRAEVLLGAHTPLQTEESQVLVVSTSITVNADYDADEITNDVAVIQLPEPVTFTDAIQVVSLPSSNDTSNDYIGTTARVSGWGLTDGFGNQISDVLNYVDVEVIGNPECEIAFGDLLPSILCTSGDQNTGSCNGDSGGPLVIDGVQIGVVSFGVVFCLPGYPSGFSRVTSFLDWIVANTDVQLA